MYRSLRLSMSSWFCSVSGPVQVTCPCRPSPPSTVLLWEEAWRWLCHVTSELPVRRIHTDLSATCDGAGRLKYTPAWNSSRRIITLLFIPQPTLQKWASSKPNWPLFLEQVSSVPEQFLFLLMVPAVIKMQDQPTEG